MASLENIHFDVPKKGARVEDRNKLQDTLELENMVSKIDNQVFGQKAAQKYASINSSRTYSKKPALSILTSSITIQSPKASPKTSPKMSPKTSPKSSPKKTMTIDYEAEGKTLVKQNEEVDNVNLQRLCHL